MRGPPESPSNYQEPYRRNPPRLIRHLVSLGLFVLSFGIIRPERLILYLQNPVAIFATLSHLISIQAVIFLSIVFIIVIELHEQAHVLFCHLRGLDPIYRRWKGYVILSQEQYYTRNDAIIVTSAPILLISVPAGLLSQLLTIEPVVLLSEIIFVANGSLIAQDVLDIIFNAALPKDSLYWISDVGDEAEMWIVEPE